MPFPEKISFDERSRLDKILGNLELARKQEHLVHDEKQTTQVYENGMDF